MSIVNSILFTIATSVLLFDHVRTQDTKNITLEKYRGIWFQAAILLPAALKTELICEWFNVKLDQECHGCFSEHYGKLPGVVDSPRVIGRGLFEKNVIHMSYEELGSSVYSFETTSFNEGNELILYERTKKWHSKVLSRDATVSTELKTEFGKLAADAHLVDVYVNPKNCQL